MRINNTRPRGKLIEKQTLLRTENSFAPTELWFWQVNYCYKDFATLSPIKSSIEIKNWKKPERLKFE